MKANSKLFTVSARDEDAAIAARLVRGQTQKQVEKFLEAEAIEKLRAAVKVEVATLDEVHELAVAGVKIEDIQESQ
jgi:hypothetical protein